MRLLLCVLAVLLGASPSSGSTSCIGSPPLCAEIGIHPDTQCDGCDLAAPASMTSTFYVTAGYNGADGIAGVELRVTGMPSGWSATATPNPESNISLGDPLAGGANIAFPTAQYATCLVLYRVDVIPTGTVTSATLEITAHSTPANPNFSCPGISPACGPCFTFICAEPGSMTINGEGDCLVALQNRTWGAVKRLYSDG